MSRVSGTCLPPWTNLGTGLEKLDFALTSSFDSSGIQYELLSWLAKTQHRPASLTGRGSRDENEVYVLRSASGDGTPTDSWRCDGRRLREAGAESVASDRKRQWGRMQAPGAVAAAEKREERLSKLNGGGAVDDGDASSDSSSVRLVCTAFRPGVHCRSACCTDVARMSVT